VRDQNLPVHYHLAVGRHDRLEPGAYV
jgi:hypothetical protein